MDDIFDTLSEIAARHPGSVALASRAGRMTYEHLLGNIASAASAVSRNGIRAGQLVVLTGSNPEVQFVLALALMRCGCRVGYNRDPALYESSGVATDVLIADAPVTGSAHPVVTPDRDWFKGAGAKSLKLPPVAEEYSMIFSSSGSTGRPKLIEYERSALFSRVCNREWDRDLGERPRLLSALGNRTAAHFSNCLAIILRGGMMIGLQSRDAATVLSTIQLFRPDHVSTAPSTIADILRHLDEKPMAFEKVRVLRALGSGSAPELQRAALERIADEMMSIYGSTESAGIAWGYSRDLLKIDGCVGRLIKDVEAAAFGPDGQMLPVGTGGEIRIKRPPGSAGKYIGDHASQQHAFRDGWFATGDLGLIDEDRNLIVRGRATNVINIGGSKVSPELVEDDIRTLGSVRDVGVAGVETPQGFEQICAAIVTDANLTVADINGHLRRRKTYWPIQVLKLVPAIPRTESGKVDRTALKRLCAQS